MKANELRQKNVSDLKGELKGLYREQFNLRMQRGIGQMSQSHRFKAVRREIARIKTILGEKAANNE